jgi:membrane associated rhomboid family serine protease
MRRVQPKSIPVQLDACRKCTVVWFDGNQFEATTPEGALENPDQMRARAEDYLAHQVPKRQEAAPSPQWDEIGWKLAPAMLGMPVELDPHASTQRPWATWSLTAVVVIVSLLAMANIQEIANRFGFVPAQAWRYGGLTFLTCFFLHGGFLHLFGNMYFQVVFGGGVEKAIGPWRFLLLIGLATVGGDLLHLVLQPHFKIPSIGASGGISGIIVFYALKFPKARLGFMFRIFMFVAMPAWVALVLWMLYQGLGAFMQVQGFSAVNSFAHLGGAATGFLLWLCWRKEASAALPAPSV